MRWIVFLLLLLSAGILVQYAADIPPELVVSWQGWRVQMHMVVAVGGLLLLCLLFFVWGRVWSFLESLPKRWQAQRAHKKSYKFQELIYEGFEALALGENKKALKIVDKLEACPDPRLRLLLKAEAAREGENWEAAQASYTALLKENPQSAVARRGLVRIAGQSGRWDFVLKSLENFKDIRKIKDPVLLRARFEALQHEGHFTKALLLVPDIKRFSEELPYSAPFYEGCFRLQLARWHDERGEHYVAEKHVMRGLKVCADFLPLQFYLFEQLERSGRDAELLKALGRCFQVCPRQDIFARWLGFMQRLTPSKKQADVLRKLTGKTPLEATHILALGEGYKVLGLHSEAYGVLSGAVRAHGFQELYKLLAEVDSDPARKSEWLEAALEAPLLVQPDGWQQAYGAWQATYLGRVRPVQGVSNARSLLS